MAGGPDQRGHGQGLGVCGWHDRMGRRDIFMADEMCWGREMSPGWAVGSLIRKAQPAGRRGDAGFGVDVLCLTRPSRMTEVVGCVGGSGPEKAGMDLEIWEALVSKW